MNQLATTTLGLLGVTAAAVLAVLDQLPLLTDAMIGAGAGAIAGKFIVRRLERRGDELPAARVRQLEWTWTGLGIALAVALYLTVQGLR